MTIITSITAVWSSIMSWITTTFPDVIALFYDGTTGLTLLGVLAVLSIGISIFFLLMRVVENFLSLRA